MLALLQTDHIPVAHHLCPRCSNWQRENKHYQKVAHSHHCYWGLKLPGVHQVLLPVYPQVHADNQAYAHIDVWENAGKKRAAITWDERCQQSDELKCLCTTASILAYANCTRAFKLHTDACRSCLGAVLYQTCDDRTNAIISYVSRSLNKAEIHYSACNLEFLTLKLDVVEKFHEYLYRWMFNVHMENNTLLYILTMEKLAATSHCWVASLYNYNFKLYYRVGKANIGADTLLRVSWPI